MTLINSCNSQNEKLQSQTNIELAENLIKNNLSHTFNYSKIRSTIADNLFRS